MQRRLKARFGSRVACRCLIVLRHLKPVFDVSRWGQEDEVFDVVVKTVSFKTHTLRRMPNSEIQTISQLPVQVRITDFKRRVSRVWSKVVQLFQRRRSVRMRVIRNEGSVLPRRDTYSRSAGKTREAFVRKNTARFRWLGVVSIVFEPAAELERHAFEVQRLNTEYGKGILRRRWRQGFFARGCEITVHSPETKASGVFADLLLIEEALVKKSIVRKRCIRFAR